MLGPEPALAFVKLDTGYASGLSLGIRRNGEHCQFGLILDKDGLEIVIWSDSAYSVNSSVGSTVNALRHKRRANPRRRGWERNCAIECNCDLFRSLHVLAS
jgi:hypothetical protein